MTGLASESARLTLAGEDVSIGRHTRYATLCLTRTLGPGDRARADLWAVSRDRIVGATDRGRLFPPLLGPLSNAESGREAVHALRGAARLSPSDGSTPMPAPVWRAVPEFVCRLARLAAELRAESRQEGLWLSPDESIVRLLDSDARAWFVPGPILLGESEVDTALRAGVWKQPIQGTRERWNAIAAARILARSLSDAAPADDAHAPVLSDLIASLEELAVSDAGGQPAPTLDALLDHLALGLADLEGAPPAPPDPIPQARCSLCDEPVTAPAVACPRGHRRQVGEYAIFAGHRCHHPRVGYKRFMRLPGLRRPSLAELNGKLGEPIFIDALVHPGKGGVVLVADDGNQEPDWVAVRDRVHSILSRGLDRSVPEPRPAPSVSSPQMFETDAGVQFVWQSAVKGGRFHFFWSSDPLGSTWEELEANAAGHVETERNDWTLQVPEGGPLYVSVVVERAGTRSTPASAGPFQVHVSPAPAATCVELGSEQTTGRTADVGAGPGADPVLEALPPCPACGSAVKPGRAFCSNCGSPLAPAEPAEGRTAGRAGEIDGFAWSSGERVEGSAGAERSRVDVDGEPFNLLVVPAASDAATLATDETKARLAGVDVFPWIVASDKPDGGPCRILSRWESEPIALAEWGRAVAARPRGFERVAEFLLSAFEGLSVLHAVGLLHGSLHPSHLAVDERSGRARIDLPLTPLGLQRPIAGAKGVLGSIPPEFGHPDRPAEPSWDLFALAGATLWSFAGSPPPAWVSDAGTRLPNLRLFVPGLPAGWAALFARMLARRADERFGGLAEAENAVRSLLVPSGSPLRVVYAGGSHVGVGKAQKNPVNQDACFAVAGPGETPLAAHRGSDDFVSDESESELPLLAGVADGVSTSGAGEFAARTVAQQLEELERDPGHAGFWQKPVKAGGRSFSHAMALRFDHVNALLGREIEAMTRTDPEHRSLLTFEGSPSATLVAVRVEQGAATVAAVGDSRMYLLRQGLLDQLTVDGDQLTELLRAGVEPRAAWEREGSKQITSWIGRYDEEGAGAERRIQPLHPRPLSESPGFDAFDFEPRVGDVLCCCSDGLSDYVDAGLIDLTGILSTHGPAAACRELIAAVNAHGGEDNVAVIVAHLSARASAEEGNGEPPCRTT